MAKESRKLSLQKLFLNSPQRYQSKILELNAHTQLDRKRKGNLEIFGLIESHNYIGDNVKLNNKKEP